MNTKRNLYKIIFILISLFIFLFSLYEIYYRTEKIAWYCFCYLIILPVIISVFILITFFTEKKFPKATQITASFLCILFLFVQIVWSGFCVGFEGISEITDINKYQKALSLTYNKNYIEHFPRHIPPNAQNIELFKSADNVFGSESIYLKFDTNSDFIDSEVSKYRYYKEFSPKDNIEYEDFLFPHINCTECKYHIIEQISRPYNIYGIAEKGNTIIYFYLNP